MLVSRNWLRDYIKGDLPSPEKIAELLTKHAFEIEGFEVKGRDVVFEVKVLPNRAHDCFSHEGIAKEISAITKLPFIPILDNPPEIKITEHELSVSIKDVNACPRFTARIIEGIKVDQSPEWLKERLIAVGQRPINNIVDITNYVMFAIGQPLHAFDLDKLEKDGKKINLEARRAKRGESLITLDEGNKEIMLDESMLVIAHGKGPIGLAGIKGGKDTQISLATKNIVIEAANFEPTGIRKTRIKFGTATDASKRFEHGIAPYMAERGSNIAARMILEIAGGKDTKIGELKDVWTNKRASYKIGVSVSEVNKILGTNISKEIVAEILTRLGFYFEIVNPRERALEVGKTLIGRPYKFGASVLKDAPNAFDCSSLTTYLFAEAGIKLPRMAVDQFVFAEPIKESEAHPGDLIFSNTGKGKIHYESVEFLPKTPVGNGIDHVGVYLGNGEVLHATRAKEKVVVEKIKENEQFKSIIGFGRILDNEERFVVTIPFERLDFIPRRGAFLTAGNTEDLIEEIGRLYGYENIPAVYPGRGERNQAINKVTYYSNVIRGILSDLGYSEIMTSAIKNKGEIELENPMAEDKRFLRVNLSDGLRKSIDLNTRNAPLLGLSQIKIFEIGKVFTNGGEHTSCALAVSSDKKSSAAEELIYARAAIEKSLNCRLEIEPSSDGGKNGVLEFNLDKLLSKIPDPSAYEFPEKPAANTIFKPISQYPFVLRDIAVFVPDGVSGDKVLEAIKNEGGELLVRIKLFDEFRKNDKVSYAFNLVFQSYDKTLSDEEVNKIMEKITKRLNNEKDWQVR